MKYKVKIKPDYGNGNCELRVWTQAKGRLQRLVYLGTHPDIDSARETAAQVVEFDKRNPPVSYEL